MTKTVLKAFLLLSLSVLTVVLEAQSKGPAGIGMSTSSKASQALPQATAASTGTPPVAASKSDPTIENSDDREEYVPAREAASAAKGQAIPRIDPNVKFKNGLLSKCQDGLAVACYQYAQAIENSDNADERKKVNFYVRRACMMAYAPACGRVSTAGLHERAPGAAAKGCFTPEVFGNLSLAPTVTAAGTPGQKIQDVEKLPVFAQAGVKTGDVILKINGRSFEGPSQIADGLESGRMDLEVERGGKPLPLTVTCLPQEQTKD